MRQPCAPRCAERPEIHCGLEEIQLKEKELVRYPMKMSPAFKDYIWGGDLLTTRFHKHSPFEKTAESWELSCHPAGKSVIGNGVYEGQTLADYAACYGEAVLGAHSAKFAAFPVLIKLIDANDNLSVQVHPDDDYALRYEHEYGKTEMWYVVDSAPGASLIYGFQKEISKEEFQKRITENTLLDVLNRVPVHRGDMFFIRSGTIHAIGKGCLIAEIQQSSNLTYRVYDYGRVGKDGKPRELHIEKAQEVTSLKPAPPATIPQAVRHSGFSSTQLATCPYFTVDLLDVEKAAALCTSDKSFHALLCTDGALSLRSGAHQVALAAGETMFLPAESGSYTLSGQGRVLLTHL